MSKFFLMSVETQSNQTVITGLPKQNTPVCFKAGGPSMTPTIRDGDSVRIRPLAPGDLRPGAILLYRKNNRLVLHRLVRKSEALLFCGDAALDGLEAVDSDDVLGVAVSVDNTALDSPAQRFRGMLRYRLRPLLREILKWRKKI